MPIYNEQLQLFGFGTNGHGMYTHVAELMSEEVVTADRTTMLDDVAEKLLREDVGSAVITDDGSPFGIVTEFDLVAAGYRTGEPFSTIPTETVTSHPLVTIDPDQSVRMIIKRMRTEGVTKLVVIDGLEVQGIVTTTDLIGHYDDLTREIESLRQQRRREESSWFDS